MKYGSPIRTSSDKEQLSRLAKETFRLIMVAAARQGITTVSGLVRFSKVSYPTIENAKAGRIMPSLTVLYRLSRALKCPIHHLLPRNK
jgi:transcriptional regulator with XRE-family HTH domain